MTNVLTVVISWVGALGVSLLTVCLTHHYHLIGERQLRDRNERHRLFGTLMGHKLVVAQLYVSRFEAFIYSDYHEHRWRLAGYPADSLDFKEAQRWMHKSEDFALEIARAHRDLYEAVASARILFPSCTELSTLTEAVYRHAVPSLVRPQPNTESAELENWKTKAVPQLQQLVKERIEKPIDALVEYLAPRVC